MSYMRKQASREILQKRFNDMSDPKITALAREYAEETFQDEESNPELPICLLNEIREEAAADFEEKIRFLLRRYCLVKKSKVEEEYNEAKFACGNVDPCSETWATYQAHKSVLERLFPEIGKEVEDERM